MLPGNSSVQGKNASKNKACYAVKVTLAELVDGKKMSNPSRQTYVNISDTNANVEFITSQKREDFNNDSLILVSANGLEIEDTIATRGISIF